MMVQINQVTFFIISLLLWQKVKGTFALAFSIKFNLGCVCVCVFSKNNRIAHKFMYSFS